jgi:hypothetical protein
MKPNRLRSIGVLAATALLAGAGCYVRVRPRPFVTVSVAPPPPPVVYEQAPPPPVEVVPAAPYPGMIWIGGGYYRIHRGWAWRRGYWRYR